MFDVGDFIIIIIIIITSSSSFIGIKIKIARHRGYILNNTNLKSAIRAKINEVYTYQSSLEYCDTVTVHDMRW